MIASREYVKDLLLKVLNRLTSYKLNDEIIIVKNVENGKLTLNQDGNFEYIAEFIKTPYDINDGILRVVLLPQK